jgi:N-acetylmuramoyl-L-alanine amidase
MTTFANIGSIFKSGLFKRRLFSTIVLGAAILLSTNVFAQRGVKISTVVIDAGHGGKDPGASGKHSHEKNITLAIALKLGHYIQEYMPDVKVIYTRKTDRFIPLYKRAEIANKNHADLFISIHCNSSTSHKPYGAETFALGLHKNNANLLIAQKENAAIRYEDNPKKYNGFDNSPESYISLSLFQSPYLKESLDFANKVEQQMHSFAGRKARGVFQAGFLVLWRTTMPSVLIETGFLSNPKEEAYLLSKTGQIHIASAIYRAFKAYKIEFEKENAVTNVSHTQHRQIVTAKSQKTKPVIDYRVQFYTSGHLIHNTATRFKSVPDVGYYKHNGVYKYTSGHFKSMSHAALHQNFVRSKGYHGAFVVAFYQNHRISISKAKEIEKTGK